ncbi:MAG: hypothetical protein HC802_05245 [Caldilineaceae bacterium]|nr:hypothetical protein [Caldilineaceae bacterium]
MDRFSKRLWAIVLPVVVLALAACGSSAPAATPTPAGPPPEAVENAAELSGVTVTGEQIVGELIDELYPVFDTVSPDGAHLVWLKPESRNTATQICIFTFESAESSCYDLPDEFDGAPYQLIWSPDSAYIAFTEDVVQVGNEADIWVMNAGDGSVTNRTNDDQYGSFQLLEPGSYTLDYVPTFNQADGLIYFLRMVTEGDEQFTSAIYRVAPDGGDAELVRSLSDDLPGKIAWYDSASIYLDGVTSISPDGSQLALILFERSPTFEPEPSGLYLVDLNDTAAPVQELLRVEAYQSALPSFQISPATPMGLSWTGDGAGIVTIGQSLDSHSQMRIFYYIDVASGDVTPIVDFSEVESLDELNADDPVSGLPLRYYSPLTASISPAGDKLLMYNDLGYLAGILTAALPPTPGLPIPTFQSATVGLPQNATASRASMARQS